MYLRLFFVYSAQFLRCRFPALTQTVTHTRSKAPEVKNRRLPEHFRQAVRVFLPIFYCYLTLAMKPLSFLQLLFSYLP